jgi:hypothetical protein
MKLHRIIIVESLLVYYDFLVLKYAIKVIIIRKARTGNGMYRGGTGIHIVREELSS